MQKHRPMGQRIQGARLDAGFQTADVFAEALGVAVGTVRYWAPGRGLTEIDLDAPT